MEPRWLTKAKEFLGVHEVEGPGSNPTILKWATELGGWVASYFKDDDIPWCALFINGILYEVGLKGPNTLAAGDFVSWGQTLPQPALGAIMTFSRPGGNHVGLYLGERADAFYILGGNQGNAVSKTWIDKRRLTEMRWPPNEALPTTGRVLLANDGSPVSTNEA